VSLMKNPAALPEALPDVRENGLDWKMGSAADLPVPCLIIT
jgi:hypothetical protein